MVTYEEAKQIAKEYLGEETWAKINTAREFPDAYVFDDNTAEYIGWIPTVVIKETGQSMNYWRYIMEGKYNEDTAKGIPL